MDTIIFIIIKGAIAGAMGFAIIYIYKLIKSWFDKS